MTGVQTCALPITVALRTANAEMSVLKSFFEFCVDREWLTANPARRVKGYKGRDAKDVRGQQKLPFSNGELERMYAACDQFVESDAPKVGRPSEVTGRDLRDFIALGVHTGLRISDLAVFRSSRMNE